MWINNFNSFQFCKSKKENSLGHKAVLITLCKHVSNAMPASVFVMFLCEGRVSGSERGLCGQPVATAGTILMARRINGGC